jgi:hypothetical protein
MVVMFYGWLDSAVRDIFEITYVNSKTGPLKSTLDGNKDIEYKKKFAIFDIRWCKTSVISNIYAYEIEFGNHIAIFDIVRCS